MATKQTQPVILPVRMQLRPDAFKDLEMHVLELPYQDPVRAFMAELGKVVKRTQWWHYPPYRQLNNAIVACAPTVVHGFEKYGRDNNRGRRMLAVGKHNGYPQLQYPFAEKIAHVIRVWIHQWGQKKYIKKHTDKRLADAWQKLEKAVDKEPDTHWKEISTAVFTGDVYRENSLAFQAIPSLLATLLHEKTSEIGRDQRLIRWRRAQDDNNSFCVVSQPLPISFQKKSGGPLGKIEDREGFFTYKLVFRVQLQTGRQKPWIHVFLHCQRYVDRPFRKNRRGNNITVLTGLNQNRLDGWERDTTLIRLQASPYPDSEYVKWRNELPELLEAIAARPLAELELIYKDPKSFWQSNNPMKDEYYIPYVEGYRYSHQATNPVATGFGLAERSEVINMTCCDILRNVLEPDDYLEPDEAVFEKGVTPFVLQQFDELSKSSRTLTEKQAQKIGIGQSFSERQQHKRDTDRKQRRERQHIPIEAIGRALRGEKLTLFIFYRMESTKVALLQQLRDAFLLNREDNLPSNVSVVDHLIYSEQLLDPLDSGNLSPVDKYRSPSAQPKEFEKDWNVQMRRSHCKRRESWREVLKQTKHKSLQKSNCQVAFIELKKEPTKREEFHFTQSAKGAIREACAREHVLSQMLLPVTLKSDQKKQVTGRDKGRVQNAVQDLIGRQLGILYGTLGDVYMRVGMPPQIAPKLDVIAFCITETQLKILYCCAVRIRANGEVDVRLPQNDRWIPYHEAGWTVGKLFGKARSRKQEEERNPIRLSKEEVNNFLEEVLTTSLDRPTVALIKAAKWRNQNIGWEQLAVGPLFERMNILEFRKQKRETPKVYRREDPQLNNLLCVVRLRIGEETPDYVTNKETWRTDNLARDLPQLSGFIDITEQNIFHYLSIGQLPGTIPNPQARKTKEDPYKSEDGGGVAFKHQQIVEMLPFFVHPDFHNVESIKALCRIPHYLRFSPAWSMGNTVLPYPMHLGDCLLEDQLCILE